jgi:hypothetical protein
MSGFILAVFLVELTPGPNMAYLATLALGRGRTAALLATLGVALGLSVHALVTSVPENYCCYIHGFMKSFAGLAWPICFSLLGKDGKPRRTQPVAPI